MILISFLTQYRQLKGMKEEQKTLKIAGFHRVRLIELAEELKTHKLMFKMI